MQNLVRCEQIDGDKNIYGAEKGLIRNTCKAYENVRCLKSGYSR